LRLADDMKILCLFSQRRVLDVCRRQPGEESAEYEIDHKATAAAIFFVSDSAFPFYAKRNLIKNERTKRHDHISFEVHADVCQKILHKGESKM
jgi:hypothetical protein